MSDTSAVERKLAELGYMRCDDGFCDMNGAAIWKASEYRDLAEALYDAWRALVARETERRWIPVSEKPTYVQGKWYEVTDGKRVDIALQLKDTFMGHALQFNQITHYREIGPLPQPPERSE